MTLRLLPLLLALLAAARSDAAAQAAAPLAVATEATDAVWEAAPDSALAPLTSVGAGDRFSTSGTLALHFADGLRLRFGPARGAALAGTYADGRYADRSVELDSGLVRYAFPEAPSAPLVFRAGAATATVSSGTGGVLVDDAELRLVVLSGEAELFDPNSGQRSAVAAGQAGVIGADGLAVRPNSLAERDLASEPVQRRRRLLVPGTDDEGNARTYIIEWDE